MERTDGLQSKLLDFYYNRGRNMAFCVHNPKNNISTGDFQEALSALPGPDAPNLSPGVISRLSAEWEQEYERWRCRDLLAHRYVYV